MDYYNSNFLFFSFVLMRMSGFIFLNPIFGRKNIPNIIKTGLVMTLTVIVFTAGNQEFLEITSLFEYGILLLKEFIMGYVLGFIVSLFSYVIIFAGELIDMEMGLSMSKIFDAQSNMSISLSATYYNILYMLLFFITDAHLALLNILITSRDVVPYGSVVFNQNLSQAVLNLFEDCTYLAVKMAFPIVALEFLSTIGMGILMKAIPQINVFVVNIQLKIFVGLFLLIMLFTPMADFLDILIMNMLENVKTVLQIMA